MGKNYFLIHLLLLLFFQNAMAQKNVPLDVTFNKNVTLFFPSPVVRGEVGANNYGFVFNRSVPDPLATLKAKPGPDSNLLVITEDGNVYSFLLSYKEDVKNDQLNVFVKKQWAIENLQGKPTVPLIKDNSNDVKGKEIDSLDAYTQGGVDNISINEFYDSDKIVEQGEYKLPRREEPSELYKTNRMEYYKKHASNIVYKGKKMHRIRSSNEDVEIALENLEYNKNEMYFLFTITNNSSMDFKINYLRFYIATKRRSKKVSSQVIEKEHLFAYNSPDRIKAGESWTFVYVFSQFSIDDKKRFMIEIYEEKGERNLSMQLESKIINNPF